MIFITGGVRSGKSAFAEQYAIELYKQHRQGLYYIASGVPFDEEMKKRILRHQQDRAQTDVPWCTIEVADGLPEKTFRKRDVILWDCITTWLNNVLYMTEHLKEDRLPIIYQRIERFQQKITKWREDGTILLLVSNEVLDEAPSPFQEVHLYRRLIGKLHQWIVAMCDEAYELDYGINMRRK